MRGLSKQQVPMSTCSSRLQEAENQPFRLFPPVIPPSVVPCKSQRKTTPKTTNKRKS
ncbi:hypothetical protein Bca4012_048655 [Brassica carinata]